MCSEQMNAFRCMAASLSSSENLVVDPLILFVLKVGLWFQITVVSIALQFTCKPETGVSILRQDVCPFTRFQTDAVGAGKTCRYESDI